MLSAARLVRPIRPNALDDQDNTRSTSVKTCRRADFARRLQESMPVPVILGNLLPMIAPGHPVTHRARMLDANRLGRARADDRAGTPPAKPNMSPF
jgi:hypothetical protein